MRKRAALYARVSTEGQADEGYSIGEQEERLRAYARSQGWLVQGTYVDPAYSGANTDRPALRRMVDAVEAHEVDVVVVYRLDRLSRSQKDTLHLIEDVFAPNGVGFVSMTESFDTSTPMGRAMLGLLSVFAQLERENIRARMAMGKAGKLRAGGWNGGRPPFGYRLEGGELVVDEGEAVQVRDAFSMFLGGSSLAGIGRELQARYGGGWDRRDTYRMLRCVTYAGRLASPDGSETFEGRHDAIVDAATWEAVQRRYDALSSYVVRYLKAFEATSLLSGLVWCGRCGARYRVTSKPSYHTRKSDGVRRVTKYRYYTCYSKGGRSRMSRADHCDSPNFRVERLDAVVLGEVAKLQLDASLVDVTAGTSRVADSTAEADALGARAEALGRRVDRLMDLYADGAIPRAALVAKVAKVDAEREALTARVAELRAEADAAAGSRADADEAKRLLGSLPARVTELPPDEQRRVVLALVERVEVCGRDEVTVRWRFS